jgi:hypothetical protein
MTGASFGVSFADLQRISLQLTETAAWLATGAVLAGAPGAEPYDQIVSAIGEFDEDWGHAITRLWDETGALGEGVAETSRRVAEHDIEAATSIQALSSLLHSLQPEPVAAESGKATH